MTGIGIIRYKFNYSIYISIIHYFGYSRTILLSSILILNGKLI